MKIEIFSIWATIIGALFVIVITLKFTFNSILYNYSKRKKEITLELKEFFEGINSNIKKLISLIETHQINNSADLCNELNYCANNLEKFKKDFNTKDKKNSNLSLEANYIKLSEFFKNHILFPILEHNYWILRKTKLTIFSNYQLFELVNKSLSTEIENQDELKDIKETNKSFIGDYGALDKVENFEKTFKDYFITKSSIEQLDLFLNKLNLIIKVYSICLITALIAPFIFLHDLKWVSYGTLLFSIFFFFLVSKHLWLYKHEQELSHTYSKKAFFSDISLSLVLVIIFLVIHLLDFHILNDVFTFIKIFFQFLIKLAYIIKNIII